MNRQEAINLLNSLSGLFDVARYVDTNTHTYFILNEAKDDIIPHWEKCFCVWNRCEACENCISAKVINKGIRTTKFEAIEDKIFSIISNYVEIDGRAYALELVTAISLEAIAVNSDTSLVINTIEDYNNKIYHDPLTHAYNRLYLNDHYPERLQQAAVAMIDLDHLKPLNDEHGHNIGDLAISTVADTIQRHIRKEDALIRFGGDEFVLIFNNISYQSYKSKLKSISVHIDATVLPQLPDISLSASIGGAYGTGSKAELIERADKMLYLAKQNRGSVIIEEEK